MSSTPLARDPIAFHAGFRPDTAAVIDLASGETLSYSQLHRRSLDCSARLVEKLGANSGERVAIIARNSAEQTVIALACERAGAIFVPLNWRLTAPELAQLLADCAPALIVTSAEFEAVTRKASAAIKARITSPEELAGADAPKPARTFNHEPPPADAPCILLYTSGTTGQPKGVIITRENAFYSSLNFSAVAVVGPRARLLCDAPQFHTVGLIAVTRTALLQGGCVILSDRFTPSATLQRLSDPALGVTHYFVVPQMIEALLREPTAGSADFSRLIALFSGGGPLSAELMARLAGRGVKLANCFGMSEVGSAIHMPLDAAYIAAHPHTVGFPAPYLDVRLAGPDGEEVLHGEVGEIWMRGPSVSPGYWRQKEATLASRSGDWFRSGDLARLEPNGAYAIVDRKKDMYISGGENVFPAEIEAVLRQCAGVKDAAVVGVPDARWGEVGVAFVEAAANPPTEAELRDWCAGRLARFKQPAHLRFVAELPRTGSGKVRKDVLRKEFVTPAARGARHAN
jgi:fatty-acyl-CoA synthase